MPTISIIIPNLNSPVIGETIASLRRQTAGLGDSEVLIVGRDEPGLVREDGTFRFLDTQVPVPPARARNIGLEAAGGELILFLDADCVADDDWLARMLACFDDPDVAVVGGGVRFPAHGYWTRCDDVAHFHEFTAGAESGTRDHLPTLNLGVRRSVVNEVGLLDERYPSPAGEDSDWTIRMREVGYRLKFEPRATVLHQHGRTSLSALLRHGFTFGYHSTKVNPEYWDKLRIPFFLRHSLWLLLVTPALAVAVTARILLKPHMRRFWYTAPGVLLAKLAWCWGAFRRLRKTETGRV